MTYKESLSFFFVCVSNCSLPLPEEGLQGAQSLAFLWCAQKEDKRQQWQVGEREILTKKFSTRGVLRQVHMHEGILARSIRSSWCTSILMMKATFGEKYKGKEGETDRQTERRCRRNCSWASREGKWWGPQRCIFPACSLLHSSFPLQ